VTFGFVARAGHSAGLRGARFQAIFSGSSPAGIGWNLWGMLPHLLPQLTSLALTRMSATGESREAKALMLSAPTHQ
jgi:hypothetical protein